VRRIVLALAAIALVGAGAWVVVWQHGNTPEAKRQRLVDEFMLCLPDSLESSHREEIRGLFDMFWYRADHGLVAEADIDTISTRLHDFVEAGRVSGDDLVYFMAQVGYKTYAGEEKYRLPSGEVDHPVLNPRSALIDLLPDTAGFADWLAERKRKQQEEERRQKEAEGQ
jgi:hypothetical protein